ncbi:2-aminoethylphosphonate--pyruvate transaminase (plasmid) [Zymomonas mobilis subsp. mobilis ZM4 = ATCC 31821]|uniref:pyridoxal-phosphate-dependent aminotransferase family protein n=2 Tax=Zymomonas mobilis TaxID=542 RepID=UPI000785A023|nr:alanine--glyoxylate aminotransferase family protein [Zymomonas mobilis]AVZ26830.1 2-aminoethylphosphonate--pyruvate transaminase [Zymomonas mobilis subsp. mobilis]AVZ28716.1 2-aminoethylphosphonate--pyruvate transaminase [Zymomonas mobilis subsp. mobilis]AVZ43162.1 2-aminoethylphosphonate--pyruvate transaminase [Zymomonas mobilis subsp. mobilis ZM4 = ATCC 31821]UBQ08748.1 alanine--glyoxylate aminotransferase family protein [Zymomonas mobilis]
MNMPIFKQLDPSPILLMGPGPINAHPRVLRAMATDMLGQFDPEMTEYMNETMAVYRQIFMTKNRWTFLIDGTARAGIEAALISLIEPNDKVLIIRAGRFGLLLSEIAERIGAEICTLDLPWGEVASLEQIEQAICQHRPKVLACVHGDTSTTMAQPLDGVGALCKKYNVFSYADVTATLGGMAVCTDEWGIDIVSGGLQKCMAGPPGSAPITISDRAADHIMTRRHVEAGIRNNHENGTKSRIPSNYFDLAMIMDYWSEKRLNHHTEATTMLYAAREAACIAIEEGLERRFIRHKNASTALIAGLRAMGLKIFGNDTYRMTNVTGVWIPENVNGENVRSKMRQDFGIEIGTAFGPLSGKIWRIGTMGYNAVKSKVLQTLGALEFCLVSEGVSLSRGNAVDAAMVEFNK